MDRRRNRLRMPTCFFIGLLAAGALVCSTAADPPTRGGAKATASEQSSDLNPRWLDRLDDDDRALLESNVGYAPPKFTDDVQWHNREPVTWDELRGRVVVLHSWTSRSAAGRSVLDRLAEARAEIDSDDVLMLAVHTPEGAEIAEKYLERKTPSAAVLIDPVGLFCDELGFYKRPTNVIIDRSGAVRYAGIRLRHVPEVVRQLLDEQWDKDAAPKPRPGVEANPSESAEFPPITGSVRSAKDVRGQRAPEFHVQQWVTAQPNAAGKVVVIDFWATWCGPCIAAIPHMNQLAEQFRDDVVCIGLSNEDEGAFRKGMNRLASSKNISLQSFKYHVALDPQRAMQNAIQVRGIPHVVVMSSDWIVRWQGHPAQLNASTLAQIVKANQSLAGGAGKAKRYRWTGKE